MICYPKNATEAECYALNDYWLLSGGSRTEFVYKVVEVDRAHDRTNTSLLARNGGFLPYHPAFSCVSCEEKYPAKSRTDYIRGVSRRGEFTCVKCLHLKKQQEEDYACKVIDDYKIKLINVSFNVNLLSFEDAFSLLSIMSERKAESDSFLCESSDDFLVTGVESIDKSILLSLEKKRAITYIDSLPLEVEKANKVLCGDYNRITYDRYYNKKSTYRNPNCIYAGVYINQPYLDESSGFSDLITLLYQRLQGSSLSVVEVTAISHIIKEIQRSKLYHLVQEISKEYRIEIDNSAPLGALLNHLAGNYAPQKLYFTFRYMADKVISYMHRNPTSEYISRHYFSKFVGDYIQFIENKGFSLEKSWSLPPTIHTSSFEAIFSQIYLNGHFNWDMLSASEVVAMWLKNIQLDDGAQDLLIAESEN